MRYFGTGTDVTVGIVGVVPVDIDLAVVGVPVDVRDIAILIARARFIA